jgi:xanthine/CO dehydrogenase XdhC/CoxF family maturation factor
MQGAIMEAGRPKVLAGTAAAVAGKLARRRGWFYRVAGPATAMIDDVAAAMPPHDHHVVFGPREPEALAAELAEGLGCGVAVVDANHLTGAWVVGSSPGVDDEWVKAALMDNPAGNEDEQTPVVILRPLERVPA